MRVFLNYADPDREVAREIRGRLAAEGFAVWMDEDVLPGQNLALAAGRALERSNAMVVLLSPASGKSIAVRRGIEYALTQIRFRNRLIPVKARPTRGFPWILRMLTIVDWQGDTQGALLEIVNRLLKPLKLNPDLLLSANWAGGLRKCARGAR